MDLTHSTPDLFAALAKAQGEIENATKNAANPHFRSRYADLAEVLNTVRPVLAAHGLSVFQSPEFDGAVVRVTTCIAHAGGGYITSTASCVPAKTDAQGIGSATTYLRRYSLAAMTGIAQEDDDGNAAAHSQRPAARSTPITPDQLAELRALIERTGTVEADFAAWIGAETLAAIPSSDYQRAQRALQAKLAKLAKQTNHEEQTA